MQGSLEDFADILKVDSKRYNENYQNILKQLAEATEMIVQLSDWKFTALSNISK